MASRPPQSPGGDTGQIPRGKLNRLRCTTAGSTPRALDGYGLRDTLPARPTLAPRIRFLSIGSHLCFALPSDPPRGDSPCASLTLHLHQVGQRTFTSELLSMPGTQRTRSRGGVPAGEACGPAVAEHGHEFFKVADVPGWQEFDFPELRDFKGGLGSAGT